jgi:hypothetical protein
MDPFGRVDSDPVETETFCRFRIRIQKSFKKTLKVEIAIDFQLYDCVFWNRYRIPFRLLFTDS